VGYQVTPQHCTIQQIRDAYRAADALGVDAVFVWDHMYPLYGPEDGEHFAALPILAAMAVETSHAHFGALVHGNGYRNPELLAYDIATMDHLSGGRAILGIGSGWFERDYVEYGYEFGDSMHRLRELEAALPRIKERLKKVVPPPPGRVPILIGGEGEKVTLRIVARYADMWNGFSPVDSWRHKNEVLTGWCAKVGRDPAEIERTVMLEADQLDQVDDLVAAGAQLLILEGVAPFDLEPLRELLNQSGR
jgi:probable F420-dependent oxidoreductase